MSASAAYERPEVLVLRADKLANLFAKPQFCADIEVMRFVSNLILSEAAFLDREVAERDANYKQIVSYGVVHHGPKLLCVRRSRKTNRKSLKLRYTVLFGGHVDSLECNSDAPLEQCLLRELQEELGISPKEAPMPLGIVADPTTAVGQLHLGIVFDVAISDDVIRLPKDLDTDEFVNSGRTAHYELKPLDEFLKQKFDPWSELFLASPTAQTLFGCSRQTKLNPQMHLPLAIPGH